MCYTVSSILVSGNIYMPFDCLKGLGKDVSHRSKLPKQKKLVPAYKELTYKIVTKKKTKKVKVYANYSDYLKSSWWKKRRKAFWLKFRKICFCCGGKANQIHHCSYKNKGQEKDEDLVAICGDCHNAVTDMVFLKEAKLKEAHIIQQKLKSLEF